MENNVVKVKLWGMDVEERLIESIKSDFIIV